MKAYTYLSSMDDCQPGDQVLIKKLSTSMRATNEDMLKHAGTWMTVKNWDWGGECLFLEEDSDSWYWHMHHIANLRRPIKTLGKKPYKSSLPLV